MGVPWSDVIQLKAKMYYKMCSVIGTSENCPNVYSMLMPTRGCIIVMTGNAASLKIVQHIYKTSWGILKRICNCNMNSQFIMANYEIVKFIATMQQLKKLQFSSKESVRKLFQTKKLNENLEFILVIFELNDFEL